MDSTLRFRQLLAHRIFHIAGLLAVGPVAAACGTSVVLGDSSGGNGGNGGGGGSGGGDGGGGVTTSTGNGGAPATSTGNGGTATASSGNGGSVSVSVSSTGTWGECGPEQTSCFDWPDNSPCPSKEEALNHLINDCSTGCWINSVDDGPFTSGGGCCYLVSTDFCGVGRPFLVGGAPLTAEVRLACGEVVWGDAGVTPHLEHLSPEQRALLAEAWTADALLEHASVAAFSRFSLELLALGAPAELLAEAHRAALDEVRHARLCFALASAYAGRSLAPSALSLGGAVEIASSLAGLAASAVVEGCIGETLAAIQAAEQLAETTDPAVRAVLATIAEDEARHAELAWRTVAWALAEGGAEVRRAVEAAFAGARQCLPRSDETTGGLEGHGRLDAATRRAVLARALDEVVLPGAARLLARVPPSIGERAWRPSTGMLVAAS